MVRTSDVSDKAVLGIRIVWDATRYDLRLDLRSLEDAYNVGVRTQRQFVRPLGGVEGERRVPAGRIIGAQEHVRERRQCVRIVLRDAVDGLGREPPGFGRAFEAARSDIDPL